MRIMRPAVLIAAAVICIASGLAVSGASAQDGGAAVKIAGPQTEVDEGDDPIAFEVTAENVDNLAGFQFAVLYNPEVLEFDSAQRGPFTESTGREVVCNDPITAAGAVRLACTSLRPTPAGPDGSGTLMTVLFKPKGAGSTDVTLDRVKLVRADETASEIAPVTVQNTSISVKGTSGFNWVIWGPVIAIGALVLVGALAFAAMRLRSGAGNPAPTATSQSGT
jgi:hypothetical protein